MLSPGELTNILVKAGVMLTKKQIADIVDHIDHDQNGEVDVRELEDAVKMARKKHRGTSQVCCCAPCYHHNHHSEALSATRTLEIVMTANLLTMTLTTPLGCRHAPQAASAGNSSLEDQFHAKQDALKRQRAQDYPENHPAAV